VQAEQVLEQAENYGNFNPINMMIDGVSTTKYIVSDWCSANGSDYVCKMNNRGYIMDDP